MKRSMGMRTRGFLAGLAMAVFAATGTMAWGQGSTATVHGHVINPAGAPRKVGDVKFTTDKSAEKEKKYQFSFPLDANGEYKGAGITPGDYLVVVISDNKSADFQNVTVKAGDDKTLDFDMTRAEYIKAMTPEARAQLEEFKKKNAAVSADNQKIANINKTLLQAREDEKNGKADVAVGELKPLVEAKPDEPILWASLGEAQLKQGDMATAAARTAKTPTNDPAILQIYGDAATSYQKAIDLNTASKKPGTPENLAAFYLNLGQSLSKSGKLSDAATAYDMSAKTAPATAATAYYNEAVVFYQASPQKLPEAAVAADKAIAADPKKADAYYIKAQALIPAATADPKTGKFILPPGCLEAYQEYLELAPDGSHAAEVKDLLNNLGQPVKNSFKAGKK
jgi:tetratricopeptide (TPR) repeat protein